MLQTLIAVVLLFVVPVIFIALFEIYDSSALKQAVIAWQKRREWKETKRFIKKLKEAK